jgi:glycosyltransferase involved in cell wall biosynthesis
VAARAVSTRAGLVARRATRAGRWALHLIGAAFVGLLVRLARRLARRPPRIWHPPSPMPWDVYLVAADRLAGYPSRALHRAGRAAALACAAAPEQHVLVDPVGTAWDDVHWRVLADLLRHGDVCVAYFDSLFPRHERQHRNALVCWLLRLLGVRFVVCAYGGDVVHRDRLVTRFDWLAREQQDYPDWDLSAQAVIARARLALFCRHARLVLPGDSVMRRFLPRSDVFFRYFPVDTAALEPAPGSQAGPPVIVHAPNHRRVKGTDLLLASLERLRAHGVPAELRLVERVPRDEALALYAQADIIADQFCMGSFGLFAAEGLALGKPVLCYLDQETLGDPVFHHPFVNTHADNLDAVLAVLLLVPALRARLGAASRASAERYQSIPALAEVWDRLYSHVWWGRPLRLHETRIFEPTRPARSFCEDPCRPEFWPVPVADLWPEIDAALRRIAREPAPTP